MIGKSKTDRNILLCYKVQCYFASTSSIPCTNILYAHVQAHELKKAYTHRHVYLLKNLYHNVLNNEQSGLFWGFFPSEKKRVEIIFIYILHYTEMEKSHTNTHTHTLLKCNI